MIKFEDYTNVNILNTEINNYLYCFNEMCKDRKDIRRYVISILRLYEKLNSLPVDYTDKDINFNRTLRKSSRYINKIKKNVKKIKSIDSNIFKETADKLYEKNGDSENPNINRYSKENWDNDQISRTLVGDISGLIKRKRRYVLSSNHINLDNSSETIYFDDYNNSGIDYDNNIDDVSNFSVDTNKMDKKSDIEKDNIVPPKIEEAKELDDNTMIEKDFNSDDSSDYIERSLIKKELIELKKEIDFNEDLFINIDHIVDDQKSVIKSYMSICKKYNNIEKMFHYIYDETSSNYIVGIFEEIYEFVGFLISEMFEHIIHVSKISCDIDSENGKFVSKYVMDSSIIDVFGKYDLFIAKIQNYVKLLNEKQGNKLSSSEKEILSKKLWDKYRLDDINPASIKEAVSLDLLSFINENPFTLVQTVPSSKINKESYKKYDLDRILDNVDFSLEKYILQLFKSIENKIMNDSILDDSDKKYAVNNIIKSFSKYIGEIHGLSEYPLVSHDYLLSYIAYKVFSLDVDIDSMFNECVQKIYDEEFKQYNSLGFFEKIMFSNRKPSISLIENKIKEFSQKIDNLSFDVE